jgi:hypothetical protein
MIVIRNPSTTSTVIARLDRAIQYTRGPSAQALLSPEYWMARLKRGMATD